MDSVSPAAAVAPGERAPQLGLRANWRQFVLLVTINAFVAGGQIVYLHSGLITRAANANEVQGVIARNVDYATVLMGANDVCASSEASMTPVDVFRDQFSVALSSLTTALPNTRVFVSSIPDVHQLFTLYRWDLGANAVWAIAGICQSMLANPWSNSSADVARRARVRQRNIDYNTVLGQVCATHTRCRFDANAVFNTAFTRSDVTTRDYFHPSVNGQAKLAAVTWGQAAGFLQ